MWMNSFLVVSLEKRKWEEHLERLANDFQYARMVEEELLLQSLFDYSKFQREVE